MKIFTRIMKTKCLLGMAILAFFMLGVNQARAGEMKSFPVEMVKFTVGMVAAFSIHESSHLMVAEITDTDLEWKSGNINQPIGFNEESRNNDVGIALLSSGLTSQVIGSEVILRSEKINKNGTFIRGMMAWNIINPISYAIDYWFIHRSNFKDGNSYKGDIQGIEHYADQKSANGFAASMVALSVFQGYRFIQTQSWAPAKMKTGLHSMSFDPLSSSTGFLLSYKIKF